MADDVREALAEALSGLHRLHRAIDNARKVVGFARDSSRLMDTLSSHGATPQSIEATNRGLDDLDPQGTAILHECEDAFAEIELQAERVRLLLGGSHNLYLEVLVPALVSLGGFPSLEI